MFLIQAVTQESTTGRLIASAAVALVLGGIAGVLWSRRQGARQAAELRDTVEQLTRQLQTAEADRRAQAETVAQLTQLRARLFANLSHEFRAPLTLILGPLRSLLDGRHGPLAPTVREQGELMLRNAQRLLRLINQILDLSRLQAGAVTLTRQPFDLVAFVRDITEAFAPVAERQGITVVFRTPLADLIVDADSAELEKVVANLLSNAVKFTDSGGIVDVSVTSTSQEAIVAVRDSGVGISAEDLPFVFERFYQVENETTRTYDGSGIGLALARELVTLHGGTITASSQPGEGSVFTMRLPVNTGLTVTSEVPTFSGTTDAALLSLDPAMVPEEEDAVESDDDRVTVLVVDDNADLRAYLRSMLVPEYRVIDAENGVAGLELARAALPDLIISDIMMPDMDGLELSQALKGDPMTDCIPVVMLTGRAQASDQIAGLEAGADAYLVKPFDPGVVVACVENLLTQRRRLRERFRQGEAPPPETAAEVPSALDQKLRPLVRARMSSRGFSPEALAEAAELSYHQLYRMLRDELGTTPSKYIRTVRAESAAELLRQGAGSVTEVAYAVGFESLSYFRRAFKERFDCAPSDLIGG